MTSHPPDYPSEYLRECAKELLEYARTMKDPELRREVEIISESYERLADRLARREDAKDDGESQKPDAAKCSGQENNSSLSAFSRAIPPSCAAIDGIGRTIRGRRPPFLLKRTVSIILRVAE